MPDDRTNLLPPERRAALRREYALKLGVIAALLAAVLTLAATALLIPSYVFLADGETAERARLASLESTVSSADEAAVSARVTTLSANAAALAALSSARSASALMRSLLAIPRPGVVLSGFTYAAASGKQPETLTVSGQAKTRDALRSYQLALQKAPFVGSASLPVSTYAKDTNIPFTIVVTLSP